MVREVEADRLRGLKGKQGKWTDLTDREIGELIHREKRIDLDEKGRKCNTRL